MNKLFFLIFFCCSFLFSQENNTSISLFKKELIETGRQAYFKKDLTTLQNITTKVDSLYLNTKDSTLLAKYYHFKALEAKLTYTNDSAFYYYHLSKDISKELHDSLAVGRRLLSLANLQREAKDFLGSEISAIEALQYLEPTAATVYLERVYNNLGLISEELNQRDEAIKYYNKTLDINKKTKDQRNYIFTVNNLGLLYQKKNDHYKAIDYFKKGLAFDSIQIKFPEHYALLLENLAASNLLLNNPQNVLKQYQEVLKLKDFKGISTTHINLSDYYKKFNEKIKALYHANEALKYAKQTHNNDRWLDALEQLSELTTGKQSTQYLQEYIQLNDSLFKQERRLKNQFAKIRYETDKKEKENVVLKTENEKKQVEISYHKQQKTIGWLVSAISFIMLIMTVGAFVIRRKKLLYQAQLQKAEAREHERQQIAKSLHDEVAGDLRLLHQKLEKSQLIEEAQKLETVKENVRNLSHQLSSVNFDKVAFKDQIINLVSDYFSLNFKIKANGLNDYDWTIINNSIKRLLYLSIRESIQNSQKHAEATKVTIDFSIRKKSVFLDITDNGIGFDTKIGKKGIGLHNLQERVEELNGTLSIISKVGEGTKTSIEIPLNARKNKNTFS